MTSNFIQQRGTETSHENVHLNGNYHHAHFERLNLYSSLRERVSVKKSLPNLETVINLPIIKTEAKKKKKKTTQKNCCFVNVNHNLTK